MAEGTYEDECNRAELLGLKKPDRETFDAELKLKQIENSEELLEIDVQQEQINNTSGKIDEINNILSITQQRINKFKRACGSLTNLLKIRGNDDILNPEQSKQSSTTAMEDHVERKLPNDNNLDTALETLDALKIGNHESEIMAMKSKSTDIKQKMSCQLDKLDTLLIKTDNAQNAMAHQNKQMKSFLR